MGKNIKYVGTVAATLLAIAPIAAPTFTLNNVKADAVGTETTDNTSTNANDASKTEATSTTSSTTDVTKDSPFIDIMTAFMNQFDNRNLSNPQLIVTALEGFKSETKGGWAYLNPDVFHSLFDMQRDTPVGQIMDQGKKMKTSPFTSPQLLDSKYKDVGGAFTVYDANGNILDTSTEAGIQNVIDNIDDMMPLKVVLNIKSSATTDADNSLIQNNIPSSLLTKTFTVGMNTFKISGSNPTAQTGDALASTNLTSDNKLNIIDNYADDAGVTDVSTPQFGQSIFDSKSSAITAASANGYDPTSTSLGVTSDVLSDGKFSVPGTYYQTVTYDLSNTNDELLNKYFAGTYDEDAGGNVNYIAKIYNDKTATEGTDYVVNKTAKTLTIVRPIKVTATATSKDIEPITVARGTKTSDSILNNKDDYALNDGDTAIATGSNIDLGNTYYTDEKVSDEVGSDVISSSGKFIKNGTYFRKITFTPDKGKIADYTLDGKQLNTTGNSVVYVQKVVVSSKAVTETIDPVEVDAGTSTDDSKLTDKPSDNYLLKDDDGTVINSVDLGSTYYDNEDDAKAGDTSKASKNATTDGKLNKGTYYRTITFHLKDGKGDSDDFADGKVSSDGTTVTYAQKIKVNPLAIKKNIETPTVNVGDSTSVKALTDTKNDTLTNSDGDTLIADSGVTFGDLYTDINLSEPAEGNGVTNGVFTKEDTYYRTVKFNLKDGVWNLYDFGGNTNTGDNNSTITYIQTVKVDPKKATSDDDEWTYTKLNGVVTTKPDEEYYTLNNDANEIINDRALAANTGWLTDEMRTNKHGVKQYRVSTHEWIDSYKVIWNLPAVNKLTDIEDANGIAYLDDTSKDYYMYKSDLSLITNSALAKNTAWKVDHVAKDAEGNIYYRVSTNEWLRQVNGVTFVANK